MLLHIGFGNYVDLDSIKAIEERINTGYINKILFAHKLKNNSKIIDFTNGKAKQCVVLLKDTTCIYASIPSYILLKRYRKAKELTLNTKDNILYVGKNNYIMISNILLVSGNTKAKPLVAKMKNAKENGDFIDFTCGEKMRSILFMKDGTIIVTSLDERTLYERMKHILII